MIRGIKETCLYVKDLQRTRAFYEGILDFEVIAEVQGRHVFFRVGKDVLLCFIAESTKKEEKLPWHGAQGSMHVAFEVASEDYEALKARLKERGVKILQEVQWRKGRSFYFRDPDGHLLEIVEPQIWEK